MATDGPGEILVTEDVAEDVVETVVPGGARPPVALYLHIPLCLSVCPYCDFVVYGARARTPGPRSGARREGDQVAAYVRALLIELALRAEVLDARFGPPGSRGPAGTRPRLRSVYLGGGTPSLLPAARIGALLRVVAERFGLEPGAEVTLEANPGPRDRGDLAGFRRAGVTRLSIGAQSMAPAELRRLGRRHTPQDVLQAVAEARRAGFESVSVDLLYDVPGQTLTSWRDTLDVLLDAAVDHVSAYALTLDDPESEGLTGPRGDHLPTRAGARTWRDRARREQDDDRAAEMYALADEMLGAAGLRWYEISNWALPGHESRHNLAYWRHDPYEAAGVGAHAFDGERTRRWNAAPIAQYLASLLPPDGAVPRLPPGGSEVLEAGSAGREQAILALRLASGLDPVSATDPQIADVLAWGRRAGLVEVTSGGAARLTMRGRLLSNEVFTRLL